MTREANLTEGMWKEKGGGTKKLGGSNSLRLFHQKNDFKLFQQRSGQVRLRADDKITQSYLR